LKGTSFQSHTKPRSTRSFSISWSISPFFFRSRIFSHQLPSPLTKKRALFLRMAHVCPCSSLNSRSCWIRFSATDGTVRRFFFGGSAATVVVRVCVFVCACWQVCVYVCVHVGVCVCVHVGVYVCAYHKRLSALSKNSHSNSNRNRPKPRRRQKRKNHFDH